MKKITLLLLALLTLPLIATLRPVTLEDLQEFVTLYKKRPIKNNNGGMKSVGQFWVWFVTKELQPDLIVESGIWIGQSTWLLQQAAPQARIISIEKSKYV